MERLEYGMSVTLMFESSGYIGMAVPLDCMTPKVTPPIVFAPMNTLGRCCIGFAAVGILVPPF
jgi:hypothetical protein